MSERHFFFIILLKKLLTFKQKKLIIQLLKNNNLIQEGACTVKITGYRIIGKRVKIPYGHATVSVRQAYFMSLGNREDKLCR